MKSLFKKIVFLSAFSVILNSAATGFSNYLPYKPDIISVSAEEVNAENNIGLYKDILNEYISKYGEPKRNTEYLDGIYAQLIDFNNDGVDELFLAYVNDKVSRNNIAVEVYGIVDGIVKQVLKPTETVCGQNIDKFSGVFKKENGTYVIHFGEYSCFNQYDCDCSGWLNNFWTFNGQAFENEKYHTLNDGYDTPCENAEKDGYLFTEKSFEDLGYYGIDEPCGWINTMFDLEKDNSYNKSIETVNKIKENTNADNNTKKEATDSGMCGKNVEWAFYENTNTLVISGSGDMYNYGGINIAGIDADTPDYLKYYGNIKNIVIEDGVTSIGNGAFYNYNLPNKTFLEKNIVIPDSVKTIGNSAFCESNNIDKILEAVEKSKVENIGAYAFHLSGSNTKTFTIPETVKSIGEGAFAYNNIESVVIPKDLSYENIKNAGFGYAMDNIHGTYYGYTGSDAEKYVNDMNKTNPNSIGMVSIDLKFIPLDKEPTSEKNDDNKDNTFDNNITNTTEKNNDDTATSNNNTANNTNGNGSQSVSNASNSKAASNNNNITASPNTGDNSISLLLSTVLSAISIAYILRKKK